LFDDDQRMQHLIGLCWQLHLSSDKGPWPLARDRTGKVMGLTETETRHWLTDAIGVLVGCGTLELVTPYDKAKRRATEYRFVEQNQAEGAGE
jgi:hypothetical protein